MTNVSFRNNKFLLIIVLVLLLVFATYLSQKIFQTSNKNPDQVKLSEAEVMHKSEIQAAKSVEDVTRNYITKTYPLADKITTQIESVGRGYGIINVTYSINGQENTRKVYLSGNDLTWKVIHEDSNKISCLKVKELVGTGTILDFYCD